MKFVLAFILGFVISYVAYGQGNSNGRTNLNESQGRVVYSTNIDFDSTMIDGQAKAPMGFFLQGRNKQSLSNMVRLRSHFRQELRRSRTAVRAMVR